MANERYRALLKDLEKAGVAYVLLRDSVVDDHPIRDLDLLISPKQVRPFATVAIRHGFRLIKNGYLNPAKQVYLAIDENGRPCILDVHFRLIYRGLEFYPAESCLLRRRRRFGFYGLSSEDFFATLFFHNLLAKHTIQDKHRDLLLTLWKEPLDWSYLEKQLRRYGLHGVIRRLRNDLPRLVDSPRDLRGLRKRVDRVLRIRRPANLWRTMLIKLRRRLVKLCGVNRGVLVAFVGPDGCGKSTTIEGTFALLKRMGLNARIAYMGPWGGSVFHFKERLRWLNPDPYREDYKAYYAGKLQKKPGPLPWYKAVKLAVRSAVYYSTLMLEMYARWWFRVMPYLRQGYIVLADRYLYDILVGYKNRPMDYHIGLRQLLCKLFPRPDVGVYLEASEETIFARKPQLQQEFLHRLLPEYRRMAETYAFHVLNTGDSLECTLQQFEKRVLPVILEKLSQRQGR